MKQFEFAWTLVVLVIELIMRPFKKIVYPIWWIGKKMFWPIFIVFAFFLYVTVLAAGCK